MAVTLFLVGRGFMKGCDEGVIISYGRGRPTKKNSQPTKKGVFTCKRCKYDGYGVTYRRIMLQVFIRLNIQK
jgi:hypothetical protein